MKTIRTMLAIFLILAMTACGNSQSQSVSSGTVLQTTPTPSGQASNSYTKSTVSADELITALESFGFEVELDTSWTQAELASELGDGVVSASVGYFSKWFDSFYEFGVEANFFHATMRDSECAIDSYETIFREVSSAETPLRETSGQGFSKAVYSAEDGNESMYGESIIISRVENTIIFFHVEWDDYQDSGTPYSYEPEEVLESIGY